MTNSVIKHNLMVEVDLLVKHCVNNSNDGCAAAMRIDITEIIT
jgi:hypothetical protein